MTYDDKTSFNIVQNLWAQKPNYILYNESKKKLRQAPHPTYFMLIPSKIIFNSCQGNGKVNQFSLMVLTPVSYTYVLEQIRSGKSIGAIETSFLPKSFFAKKGDREIQRLKKIKSASPDLYFDIETFPMLVILTEIQYQFWGSTIIKTEQFLTTPLGKVNISNSDFESIKQYISDNYKHSIENVKNTENIYEKAHMHVVDEFKNLSPKNSTFWGGKEGGYNGILKKINKLVTPHDPMRDFNGNNTK